MADIKEILEKATPRPWKRGLYGGDSERGKANSRLSMLAVNAYEPMMREIEDAISACCGPEDETPDGLTCQVCLQRRQVLRLARGESNG